MKIILRLAELGIDALIVSCWLNQLYIRVQIQSHWLGQWKKKTANLNVSCELDWIELIFFTIYLKEILFIIYVLSIVIISNNLTDILDRQYF